MADIPGKRNHPRYVVQWNIVIVYKKNNKNETYRGKIADVSLGGASLFSADNIFTEVPVVVTIEIPPYKHIKNSTIVGLRCSILHSVHSSNFGKYRIGLKFISFNAKGEANLTEALSGLIANNPVQNPYG